MKKEEEQKPIPWEAGDPKLPVVRSGHLENRAAHSMAEQCNGSGNDGSCKA